MQLTETLLVNPIINILVVFYHALSFLHIPYALGFSIILLTVAIRLVMYPLTTKQLQLSKKMQDLAPHLSNIKDKHKGDARRQQEATMALYKEHNVNPAAGCLPGVVQIVVLLFGLYPALQKVITANPKDAITHINHILYSPALHLNQVWDASFLGLPLGHTPAQLLSVVGPIIFLVPLLTGVFQFIQSKMMAPVTPQKALSIKKEKKEDDFATTFQKQSMYLLPVMIAFFSYNFSIGLSLYWNTFSVFGIIQQYKVAGLGSLGEWVKRNKK